MSFDETRVVWIGSQQPSPLSSDMTKAVIVAIAPRHTNNSRALISPHSSPFTQNTAEPVTATRHRRHGRQLEALQEAGKRWLQSPLLSHRADVERTGHLVGQ